MSCGMRATTFTAKGADHVAHITHHRLVLRLDEGQRFGLFRLLVSMPHEPVNEALLVHGGDIDLGTTRTNATMELFLRQTCAAMKGNGNVDS